MIEREITLPMRPPRGPFTPLREGHGLQNGINETFRILSFTLHRDEALDRIMRLIKLCITRDLGRDTDDILLGGFDIHRISMEKALVAS
jgi:hypothetical protein